MTAAEARAGRLRRLAGVVRADLSALDGLADRIEAFRLDAEQAAPEPVAVMGAGAWLHHYYTGVETCLDRCLRAFEGPPDRRGRWHRDLLEASAVEVAGVRPAGVRIDTRDGLDRLREFRHLFRNAYRIDLVWEEMRPRCGELPALHREVRSDLEAFCEAVSACAARLENDGRA